MSRDLLQDIIEDFNPDKFVRFFREKNRSFAPRKEELAQYNDENFKSGIKLGEIQFAQDEKLLICAFEANQPLSERSGKKAQYEKGKKILKDSQSDAGIFIFYDDNGNFRFSLIYANYLGKKRDWSIFRRFTYFVSKEYTNKTFLQQIGEEDFSSLEKIKDAFSVEKVTKSFYTDIANWYFWAIQKTEFPTEAEKEENGRNVAVIRLITRLIFIWFMKEKGLIQQNLFNHKNISTLLKDLSPKNTQYYKAILQNLFFATLNTKIEDRKFRFGKSFQGKNKDYMDHGIYRYEDYFKNKEDMLEIFKDIPFLNGGLFDCLDRRITENDKNIEIRIDGFTDKDVGLKVPNVLFFSDEINVDLNKEYGTKNKKYKVRGLIDILSSYNFTIDENDPNDADVALDPELLGKVFENLLASFNPETATTARKATGSYYTPREIVNYMVDESLTAYLSNVIDSEASIRNLISFTDKPSQFTDTEADTLIRSIDNVKILDPAVGSGAFPMGMLHKLVYILGRLDPDNSKWRELQRQKAIKETEEAYKIGDKEERRKRLLDINEVFDDNASDYGRKLYLIENCIYGVDIQPIAVQIAKLRFFISLLVDQGINPKKENLGIRPLPNLETKFVAANTLIGIERPAQGLLRNPEINRKEADLKKVRERHFTARTPKTKQKCIEDDKKLRAEISELLKKDDFPAGVTEKLANWNPYNQSASADFFDPEWMFGITEGFDVVIGNPPYVDIKALPSEDVRLFFKLFETSLNRINLYAIFIEKGYRILNSHGVLCYINPNSMLINESYKKLRKLILKDLFSLIKLPDHSFEVAIVETIILLISRGNRKSFILGKYFKNNEAINFSQILFNKFSREEWGRDPESRFSIFAEGKIDLLLKKIETNSEFLSTFVDFSLGITPYDKYKGHSKELIDKRGFHSDKQLTKEYVPLISGGNILPFIVTDEVQEYLKYGAWLGAPRDKKFFINPKIIVRQIVSGKPLKIYAGYSEKKHFFTQIGFSIIAKNGETLDLKFSLALLNSSLINFYHNYRFLDVEKIIFQKVLIANCKKFPIKKPGQQQPFIALVDQILAAKQKDPNADTSALERQIDKMVYELYGLTEDEIKIVEGVQ